MKKLLLLLSLLTPAICLAADVSNLSLGGRLYAGAGEGSTNMSTHALDATTDAFGCVMQVQEAATITQACFLVGFSTGTKPTYIVSLQSLDANGFNSGTVLGGGSPASATFTPGSDGAFQCVTLANSIALTRGQHVAINVAYSSGTINASNYEEFGIGMVSNGSTVKNGFPYCYTNTAGSLAKTSTRFPVFAIKSASKTYGMPGTDVEVTAYSSDSSPDEYGLAFTIPASSCDTYKVRGITCLVRQSATAKTVDVKLYTGTTQLQILDNLDSDIISATPASGDRVAYEFLFTDSSLTALTCGSSYTIGFVPNETASNFALGVVDASLAAELSAWPGGTDFFLRTRVDAGAWTDVTDKRPLCQLILEDITEPAGGSAVFRANSAGGFQR